MKHRSSQEFYRYWNGVRGEASAPARHDFDPEPIRHLLGDSFVISYDQQRGHPVRMAGTRLCARFGRDLRDDRFAALWASDTIAQFEDLLTVAALEQAPLVVGLTGTTAEGRTRPLELTLLPFQPVLGLPPSLTGLIVELESDLRPVSIVSLRPTSWRHLRPRGSRLARLAQRLRLGRGITAYDAGHEPRAGAN